MRMLHQAFVLVCDTHKTYTLLNRFDARRGGFEGEYSLLHNRYSQDQYFLARFLLAHQAHAVMLLSSADERYDDILHTYDHFMADDISKYIEEVHLREQELEQQRSAERSLGHLPLFIARQMIEKEWEVVRETPSRSERETYVLL
ncbi:MAG: hypothetical protein K6T31_03025, partial [Alicyclobacillus sp.]|nr:hypothetical protein [Alicyclobacillus sp.]